MYLEPNVGGGPIFESHSHIYFSVFPNWSQFEPLWLVEKFFLRLIDVNRGSHHPIIPLRKAKKHKLHTKYNQLSHSDRGAGIPE